MQFLWLVYIHIYIYIYFIYTGTPSVDHLGLTRETKAQPRKFILFIVGVVQFRSVHTNFLGCDLFRSHLGSIDFCFGFSFGPTTSLCI